MPSRHASSCRQRARVDLPAPGRPERSSKHVSAASGAGRSMISCDQRLAMITGCAASWKPAACCACAETKRDRGPNHKPIARALPSVVDQDASLRCLTHAALQQRSSAGGQQPGAPCPAPKQLHRGRTGAWATCSRAGRAPAMPASGSGGGRCGDAGGRCSRRAGVVQVGSLRKTNCIASLVAMYDHVRPNRPGAWPRYTPPKRACQAASAAA